MSNVLNFAPRPRVAGRATDYQLRLIAAGRATHSALNIRTPRCVQIGGGMLCRVFVIAMPSTSIRIYDARTVAKADTDSLLIECDTAPPTNMLELCVPVTHGIVIDPGEGGHVTASFN